MKIVTIDWMPHMPIFGILICNTKGRSTIDRIIQKKVTDNNTPYAFEKHKFGDGDGNLTLPSPSLSEEQSNKKNIISFLLLISF